ncbi:MAG: GtrA family protein [Clostridia bacterium]|nr:GtrA family protein [Clostridia bacterium]
MIELIKQLVKFGFVGGICFVIDYGVMVLLTEVAGMEYLLSCGISFTVSVIANYILSMKFVFERKDNMDRRVEFIIFVIMSVIGLGLTELLMWVFVDKADIHYMISKIVVTAIVMVYNFVTRKIFLEKKKSS